MLAKPHAKYYIIKLAVFTILAAMVFIFRVPLVEHLKYFIGGLMLLYGVEEIAFEAIYHHHHILHQDKFYLGFIEVLLGTVMLLVDISYEGVCIIWATWSVLRESYEIKEVFSELKCLAPKIISGLESLVVIVFSILLIIQPDEHSAMTHLYLLLVELLLTPFTPLLDEILKSKNNQEDDHR